MIKLKSILTENISDTFQMYHGGKRWSRIPTELIGHNQGRYEAGVGIYFTNDYNTARRYAKGSRIVQLVDIDKNFKHLHDVHILTSDMVNFVKTCSGMKHKSEIIDRIKDNSERMGRDWIYADVLKNLIVNYEAGTGNVGIKVANYLVSKGADAHVDLQSGKEFWLVVMNPKIIKNVAAIDPKKVDSGFPFMLNNPFDKS